jgi:hypothetical protein
MFPFGKKKSPNKSKKSMMVRIPLEKLRSVTPVKKNKTSADLKLGLAQKKIERTMQDPLRVAELVIQGVSPWKM